MPKKVPNDGRFHVQFRVYKKEMVEFLATKDGTVGHYVKSLIEADMAKQNGPSADAKLIAAAILSSKQCTYELDTLINMVS